MAKICWAVLGLHQDSRSYVVPGDAAGFRFLWHMYYSADIFHILMIKSNSWFWMWNNLMLDLFLLKCYI
jgi:hypothetical protein